MSSLLKNPATLYIVRHGQTDWNVEKRIQGQVNTPLNANGEQQAHQAKIHFKDIHFDAVFSSDLLRAKRTAEIITLERKLAIKTTKALRERSFGPLEGIYLEELKVMEKDIDTLSDAERFTYKSHPGIESDEELIGRLIVFLREVSVAYANKTVLIVCHGSLMRTFLIHIGMGTYQTLGHGTIENTAYVKLLSDGVEFEVQETQGVHKHE